MRRIVVPLLGPACAVILLLVCFRAVLFGGEQFAYRDSGHFYYPLYLRIQQEWNAGRWPLWDPGQNAGLPLLGMPMSAVFYPGKLLYAIFAYPWATRLYTIIHVAIAWAGTFALARAWRQSHTAASLAGMAYAFGAPVLFQYCNIIFLVGAAWVPWGFLALEWLLHQKRRSGLLGLAVVLTLQVLGGDPEAAYLTVLCGAAYALVLAAGDQKDSPRRRWPWWWNGAAILGWVALTLGAACAWPRTALPRWLPPGRIVQPLAWGLLGLWVIGWWWQRGPGARLATRLAALAAACALAVLLAAVQLVPILEYAGYTARAADDRPGRIYGFCVEPYRVLEAAWPGAYGRFGPENRSWVHALPPAGERQVWTPSLYLGGLTLVLALGGLAFRGAPPWRRWLSLVAVVAVAASFGRFGGPLWLVRWLPGAAAAIGPHDPLRGVDRIDRFLHDGAGSVYGLLAAFLPGFNLFRYPAKLLIFATLALAALAGDGWDRVAAGLSRASRHASGAALAVTLATLVLVLAARGPIVGWLSHQLPNDIEFGPVDPAGAFDATVGGLVHGGLIFALAWGLTALAPRSPRWIGAGVLIVMALDLGVANARLVWTVPQADFERPSRAAQAIAAAERVDPSSGPFRVHRMGTSYPDGFARRESPRRLREAIDWERDTLHPLYALPTGLAYTLVQGIIEIDDYAQFFGTRLVTPRDASGSVTGPPVYSFPRRSFDLWNSRYFLMPIAPEGWQGEEHDFVRVYPPAEVARDPERAKPWIERENWQLLRNKSVFPRAWLVHFVRVRKPIARSHGIEQAEMMNDLVYQSDAYWNDPNRGVYDLRSMAFVETDQPQGLAGYVSRTPVSPAESVAVTRHEAQRVELVASLQQPGLVILADTYFPGWNLTIDGVPAPVYRTNRLMRGAAVKAGRHTLVYTYDPDSFRIGKALSIVGLMALAALVPWARAAGRSQGLTARHAPYSMLWSVEAAMPIIPLITRIGVFDTRDEEKLPTCSAVPLLGPACALILLLLCFRAVLFGGEQFAYRDAAYFYYPLYLRIQQEWAAGRWPLWDPGQNAGMPLLGMPMSAVFYPGKLLYAALAYAWATRLYTIAHVAIAWAGTFALARAWRQSHTAASLAGMAYAFGAPVLFQYCNVIFLVGAAWVPWGFLTLERLLHQKRRSGLLGLAVVLSLQVLGGDPEAAYLTALGGGGYVLLLAAADQKDTRRRWPWWWGSVAVLVWVALTLGAAYAGPRTALPQWLPAAGSVRFLVWGLVGMWVIRRCWKRDPNAQLAPRLAALAAACALAVLLAAVQLVPILEYAGNTARAADDRPGRIYGFCVEPYRLLEALWPGAYGTLWPENRSWIQAVPPADERMLWTPSLYLGGLTLVLALGGFGFRGGPPWRRWLTLVAVVAVAASFGRFGGPLWLVRWLPGVSAFLGPHDPVKGVDRVDPFLHDGAGSVYGVLAALLPGFDLFRYPAKLLTFATMALATLAGHGWDRLAACRPRAPRYGSGAALAVTLATLVLVLAARGPIVGWLSRQLPNDIEFGPVDPRGAFEATVGGLVHGGLVFALAWGLAALAPARPRWAGAGALLVMALDLGVANARLIWTVPQADFERPSRAARAIADAERADPAPAPFRVHRVDMLYPSGFHQRAAPRRLRDVVAWKRDSLEPLFGLPLGLEHTIVQSVLELDDYVQFFGSRLVTPHDAIGVATGPPVYSFPRRGFDLWDSRYVVLSVAANGWLGKETGLERIDPPAEVVEDPARARRWIHEQNWQLLRNQNAYPRAWLVHTVRVRNPIRSRTDPEHHELMQDLVYQSDAFLREPGRSPFNPRVVAFVETDQPQSLTGYVSRTPVDPAESVAVTRYEPQRLELVATLDYPGLVILADVDYPGWNLTIDGAPAPIYRANRMMRGAAVKAGRHTLVYTYDPASFRIGGALSLLGLLALAALVPWARAQPN